MSLSDSKLYGELVHLHVEWFFFHKKFEKINDYLFISLDYESFPLLGYDTSIS